MNRARGIGLGKAGDEIFPGQRAGKNSFIRPDGLLSVPVFVESGDCLLRVGRRAAQLTGAGRREVVAGLIAQRAVAAKLLNVIYDQPIAVIELYLGAVWTSNSCENAVWKLAAL